MSISKKRSSPFYRWGLGWLPLWAYSIVVVVGAVLPSEKLPVSLKDWEDGVLHAVEYFLLFVVALHAMTCAKREGFRKHAFVFSASYAAVMATLTESLQFFVPTRYPELSDWIMDLTGAGCAWAVATLFFRWRKRGEAPTSGGL